MLIRSQDNKKITNDLCLEIIENEYIHGFEIFNNSIGVIGEYSTEEKAIKVLDMIQEEYANGNEWLNVAGKVFHMPQEDEVNQTEF